MLIFDMDGVLTDSNGVWKEVDVNFLAKRGMEYTMEYYDGVAHTVFPKAAVFTKEYCHLEDSCEEIMAEWMEMAGDVYAKEVPCKPYVIDYLEKCHQSGEKMIVLTSAVPQHCKSALDHLNLNKYFDRVFFAQEIGIDKQNPELFTKVCEMMDVSPENCTLYDDSIASCRSAKKAGLKTVGVFDRYFDNTFEEMKAECDVFIESFKELL